MWLLLSSLSLAAETDALESLAFKSWIRRGQREGTVFETRGGQCKGEKKFLWGSATAAYQVEGAVAEEGRSPSIWDTFSHTPGKTYKGQSGDNATESYHMWREDLDLMKGMGLGHYRFSISWSRILPDGINVNMQAVKHYQRILFALFKSEVTPVVTMFHWDLPEVFRSGPVLHGGWLNPDIADHFERYADVLFEHFGPYVQWWATFNEILTFCNQGYGSGSHAPGRCSDRSRCDEGDSGTEPYICNHNVLRSHAKAYRVYDKKYRARQKGKLSAVLNCDWAEPWSNSEEDRRAAERDLMWQIGTYAHPIRFGDYPTVMRDYVGDRLPKFTVDEKLALRGSSDYFALNHYTTHWVQDKSDSWNEDGPFNYMADTRAQEIQHKDGKPIGPPAASSWLYKVPWGMRKLANWVWETYGQPIIVTENGCSGPGENTMKLPDVLNDAYRVDWYQQYTKNLLMAKEIDGVPIMGYTAWSLLDNFEWAMGYSERFGLHYVDYDDGKFTRYAKNSSVAYTNLIADYRKNNPNEVCDW